jgi:dienelactone hydrolase
MIRMLALSLFALAATPAPAIADPAVKPVKYEIDGTAFESLLVYNDTIRAVRPGLVMVPNWKGINDTAIARAREIAGDRYVVLLVDMYGADVRPDSIQAAGQASAAVLSDRALTRTRVSRAVAELRTTADSLLQPGPVVAFGFCFGGTVALELARSGAADVAGVVSFHGDPGPVDPAGKGEVLADILVLHGAADGFVPAAQLRAFEQEMDAAGADWTLVSFSGAQHWFAESEADGTPPGCQYHAAAAERAFGMFQQFLDQRL